MYSKEDCAIIKKYNGTISPKTYELYKTKNAGDRAKKVCNNNYKNLYCINTVCENVNNNINPFTMKPFNSKNQKLKTKLINDCANKPADKDFCECVHTESERNEILDHCRKFQQDDTKNPKTDRKIKKDGKKYKELKYQCNMCMKEINVDRLSQQSSQSSSSQSSLGNGGFSPNFSYSSSEASQEQVNEINALEANLRDLDNQISILNERERLLSIELEAKESEIDDLKTEMKNIKILYDKCREDRTNDYEIIETLKKNYNDLNQSKIQLENDKKTLEDQFLKDRDERVRLLTEITEKNELIENLKLQIQDKDNNIKQLKTECDEQLQILGIQLSNKEKEIKKLIKRIQDLEESGDIGYDLDDNEYNILDEFQELENQYNEIKRQYDEKNLEFQELNLLSQQSIKIIESKNTEISNLDKKYKSCVQNIKDSEDETKKRISELVQQINKIESENSKCKKDLSNKNKNILDLQKQLQEQTNKYTDIKNAVQQFLNEAERKEKENEENDKKFNMRMKQLENENIQKSNRIQQLELENSELIDISERLRVPEGEINQESFLEYNQRLEQYEQDIRDLERLNNDLKDEILQLNDSNNITIDEYNEYRNLLLSIIDKLNYLGFNLRDNGIEIDDIGDINDILNWLDIINDQIIQVNVPRQYDFDVEVLTPLEDYEGELENEPFEDYEGELEGQQLVNIQEEPEGFVEDIETVESLPKTKSGRVIKPRKRLIEEDEI